MIHWTSFPSHYLSFSVQINCTCCVTKEHLHISVYFTLSIFSHPHHPLYPPISPLSQLQLGPLVSLYGLALILMSHLQILSCIYIKSSNHIWDGKIYNAYNACLSEIGLVYLKWISPVTNVNRQKPLHCYLLLKYFGCSSTPCYLHAFLCWKQAVSIT